MSSYSFPSLRLFSAESDRPEHEAILTWKEIVSFFTLLNQCFVHGGAGAVQPKRRRQNGSYTDISPIPIILMLANLGFLNSEHCEHFTSIIIIIFEVWIFTLLGHF